MLLTLAGELARADVVLFGTSSLREALLPEAGLQPALAHKRGGKMSIVNLSSAAQTTLEALFLATLRPAPPGQIYVVFLGFGALQYSDSFDRLEQGAFLVAPDHLLDAYTADCVYPQRWAAWPSRLAMRWGALRQRLQRQIKFGLRSRVREAVYGLRTRYLPYFYEGPQAAAIPDRTLQLTQAKTAIAGQFEVKLSQTIRALDLLAQAVQRNGSRLVIASPPDSGPELRQALPVEYGRFDGAVTELVQRRGMERVDWNAQLDWNRSATQGDFIDAAHVSKQGRDKWSASFVAWLDRPARHP